jgi:hypothetical protein
LRELVLGANLLLEDSRQPVIVDAFPVRTSLSSSGTKIMLDLKLLATRLPTMPERAMFCFSCSTLCGEPS